MSTDTTTAPTVDLYEDWDGSLFMHREGDDAVYCHLETLPGGFFPQDAEALLAGNLRWVVERQPYAAMPLRLKEMTRVATYQRAAGSAGARPPGRTHLETQQPTGELRAGYHGRRYLLPEEMRTFWTAQGIFDGQRHPSATVREDHNCLQFVVENGDDRAACVLNDWALRDLLVVLQKHLARKDAARAEYDARPKCGRCGGVLPWSAPPEAHGSLCTECWDQEQDMLGRG